MSTESDTTKEISQYLELEDIATMFASGFVKSIQKPHLPSEQLQYHNEEIQTLGDTENFCHIQ